MAFPSHFYSALLATTDDVDLAQLAATRVDPLTVRSLVAPAALRDQCSAPEIAAWARGQDDAPVPSRVAASLAALDGLDDDLVSMGPYELREQLVTDLTPETIPVLIGRLADIFAPRDRHTIAVAAVAATWQWSTEASAGLVRDVLAAVKPSEVASIISSLFYLDIPFPAPSVPWDYVAPLVAYDPAPGPDPSPVHRVSWSFDSSVLERLFSGCVARPAWRSILTALPLTDEQFDVYLDSLDFTSVAQASTLAALLTTPDRLAAAIERAAPLFASRTLPTSWYACAKQLRAPEDTLVRLADASHSLARLIVSGQVLRGASSLPGPVAARLAAMSVEEGVLHGLPSVEPAPCLVPRTRAVLGGSRPGRRRRQDPPLPRQSGAARVGGAPLIAGPCVGYRRQPAGYVGCLHLSDRRRRR